jgi:hypothetical protein
MNLRKTCLILQTAIIMTIVLSGWACANDSAVAVTPTGLHFKRETNVSLEREELHISQEKVEVSYEFKNLSDKSVVTEIAFPIPDYSYSYTPETASFDDFTVEVNRKAIPYKTDVRASLNGKDYTHTLKRMNISIADFGHYDAGAGELDTTFFKRLNEKDRSELISLGLVRNDGWPFWIVSKKYHWSQAFPVNKSVTIKHTYKPYQGGRGFGVPGETHFLETDACLDKKKMTALEKYARPDEGLVWAMWVSYILTTANNWKQPIKKFHLIVEKQKDDLMSLCFDHPLAKTGANRYEVVLENFVPTTDLKVYFFFP